MKKLKIYYSELSIINFNSNQLDLKLLKVVWIKKNMSISHNTSHIVQQLYNIDTVKFAAVFAGFAWSYGKPKFLLENPFSSILSGAIGASFAVFCAKLVDRLLPENLRPVLIGALSASGIYYIYRSFTRQRIELAPPRYNS